MPTFKDGMSEIIGTNADVFVAENDDGTICFNYPGSFHSDALQRVIRLEIGALAAWTPTQIATVKPDVATYYPNIFSQADTNILTTTAERTFWEKATILHQEAFRPEKSTVPMRYSRHYYDVHCMVKTTVKEQAMAQPKLLEAVAKFKQKFYPRKWARYELARVGSLKLLPAEHSVELLREDYAKMRSMIYGKYPSFDEILAGITVLEKEINK